MRVEEFEVKKSGKLVGVVGSHFSNISLSKIKSALKNKDIKVDGKRVKENVEVDAGQVITLYLSDDVFDVKIDIIFEDRKSVV